MSSSYISLHSHFIFGTKHRDPCIAAEWRARLHDYLGGTARALGCVPLAVGGIEDHVHLLLGLRATHAPADLMREIKKASSLMVRRELGLQTFAWQEGYAAISVSPTAIAAVTGYVERQEEHHREASFDDELERILGAAQIAFARGTDMR